MFGEYINWSTVINMIIAIAALGGAAGETIKYHKYFIHHTPII